MSARAPSASTCRSTSSCKIPSSARSVVVTTSLEARNRLMPKLQVFGREKFVGTDVFIHTLDLGPPVGRPIQYRLSGPDIQASARDRRSELMKVVASDPHLYRRASTGTSRARCCV